MGRPVLRRLALACAVLMLAGAVWLTGPATAQAPAGSIKIGLLYDHTGPFAEGGSLNSWRGAKMIIAYVNEHGGVAGKYKIVQVDGDSQSKGDVALNEAERLLNVEKVDVLAGLYSSAQAVPLAERMDKEQKLLWITTAISSKVFDGRNLHYVFRPQPTGDQVGKLSVQYIADYAQEKFGRPARDLRLAIIYEDGPYGTDVSSGNEAKAKELGLNVVLKEAYSAQAPDLSSLVTKLRAARPDVLFHTGYNPDITLFLRQAEEGGLRVRAYIGHGAGHSQLDKLKENIGADRVEGFHTVDPAAAQLLDPNGLRPGVWAMTQEMVRRYRKEFGEGELAPHVSMGFNNLGILLTDVLPRAIQKYGGWSPDAIARAARETDIPDGGTIMGYGVKFYPPGHRFAGQNERAFPVVDQVIGGRFQIVYPTSLAQVKPAVLLPRSSPLALQ
ncbi:MAG: ABC transporter ATP-binding protein [Bacillati bacterium ANGP1]|uniref:ABC transporter ATP-binding protein n=1 Tax=Candidatus Segetimicrobium genomatis TaxID=2569760 RepID=A0A537KCZ4_9BACT|nr:MAG: ABC transporter ATP-binding protein [Terrabacteria group bacterium ANGP1]